MAFSSIQKERPASSAMAARLSGHSAGNGWRSQASLAEIVLRWDWVDRETSLRLVFECSQSLSTFATASLLKLLCSKKISETESQGSTANKRSRHWWHEASFTTLIDSSIGADLADEIRLQNQSRFFMACCHLERLTKPWQTHVSSFLHPWTLLSSPCANLAVTAPSSHLTLMLFCWNRRDLARSGPSSRWLHESLRKCQSPSLHGFAGLSTTPCVSKTLSMSEMCSCCICHHLSTQAEHVWRAIWTQLSPNALHQSG